MNNAPMVIWRLGKFSIGVDDDLSYKQTPSFLYTQRLLVHCYRAQGSTIYYLHSTIYLHSLLFVYLVYFWFPMASTLYPCPYLGAVLVPFLVPLSREEACLCCKHEAASVAWRSVGVVAENILS